MSRGKTLRPPLDARLLAAAFATLLGGCMASPESGPGTGGGPGPNGGSVGTPGTAGGNGGTTASGAGGTSSSVGAGGTSSAAGTSGSAPGAGGSSIPGGTTGGPGSGGASATGTGGTGSGLGGRGGTGTSTAGTAGTMGSAGATGLGGAGGTRAGAGGGAAGAAGATGTGGQATGAFQKAAGKIPNAPQPASTVNLPKADWQKGIISPSLQVGKQVNQPSVLNGYLLVAGNEEFWIYDVANPAMPKQISTFATPNRTGGEAESHTVSFARYGNTFYAVTIGGRGIDIWDLTTVTAPKHIKQIAIPGTNYGDYTEAVWGVSWQGQYIYVGATNNGIKVVDAANPATAAIVADVPTSQYGGVSAGPLDAIGNVLVVTTPKESGGIATLDITDPTKPVRLASLTTDAAYIGMFYRRWVFLIGVKAWDVLSNPRSIGSGSSPLGSLSTEGSEYMSFSDDYMYLGHVRTEISGNPGVSKISVADPRSMKVTSRVWGRMNLAGKNDDQFNITLGPLVVIGDDQSPYHGWFIAVHSTDPDTKPPVVDTVIPRNQETGVATKSRIGVTFSDNIELATVSPASFIVRPMGGQPLVGKWGARMGVVNFDPDQDLLPGTTYEVVLAKGGIADLVGNTLAAEWKSTFTTAN